MHKMESALKCEVCIVAYNSNEQRPRFLPCGHSMCSSCIKETLRSCNNTLACPFCRTQCGTGFKTLDDFPTAFALLNLLDKTNKKTYAGALSTIDKANKVYLEKKQSEYDSSMSRISNCNRHLKKLLHSKKLQETMIKSIETEQNKLENFKKKIISKKDQLDVITAMGIDIMKWLQVFQDSVKYSTNLSQLTETIQNGQIYYTASKEWIASTANSIVIEETHKKKRRIVEANSRRVRKLMEHSVHGNCLTQKTTLNNTASTATSVSPTAVNTFTTSSASTRARITQHQQVSRWLNPIQWQVAQGYVNAQGYNQDRGLGRQKVQGSFNAHGYNQYLGKGRQ